MRYVLKVSYDGTHFSGWQTQKNARTVQETLEKAAAEIFGATVRVAGSGRTDAGVHARAQICHLDGETNIPAEKLRECFNRILPPDVSVLESGAAPAGFDCTRAVKKKTYCYRAYYANSLLPLSERYEVRLPAKPDIERMRHAAKALVGEHDFKAFCASGSSAKTSVRTIYSVEAEEHIDGEGAHYLIRVCGNGFLYNMVRIIAGELFEIGCGKDENNLKKALITGQRTLLARTMPAKGLEMSETDYGFLLFPEGED